MIQKYIYIHASECRDYDSRGVTRLRHAGPTNGVIAASIGRRRARLTIAFVAGHQWRPRACKRETRVPRSARGSLVASDETCRSRTRRRSSAGAGWRISSDRRGNHAGAVRMYRRSRKTRSNNTPADTSAAVRAPRSVSELHAPQLAVQALVLQVARVPPSGRFIEDRCQHELHGRARPDGQSVSVYNQKVRAYIGTSFQQWQRRRQQ